MVRLTCSTPCTSPPTIRLTKWRCSSTIDCSAATAPPKPMPTASTLSPRQTLPRCWRPGSIFAVSVLRRRRRAAEILSCTPSPAADWRGDDLPRHLRRRCAISAPTGESADPPLLWRRQCPTEWRVYSGAGGSQPARYCGGQSDAVHVRKVNMGGYATGNALARRGSSVVSI